MGVTAAAICSIGWIVFWVVFYAHMPKIEGQIVDPKIKRRNRSDAIAALMRFDRPLSQKTMVFILSEVYEIATNGEHRQCLEVTGIRRCCAPSVVIGYKISEGQLIAVHGCERGHRKEHAIAQPDTERTRP